MTTETPAPAEALMDVLTRLQDAVRVYRHSRTVDALDASDAVNEVEIELGELLCPLDDRPDFDLSALALPAQAAATEGELENVEEQFTFPGGTVPLPVLRDPVTGERFLLPVVAQVQHSLTHRFTPSRPDLTTLAEEACLSKVTLTLDRLARKEEWAAEIEHDRVGYSGRGDTPEAALVEAIVDKGIGDYYYAADWDGPALTTEQMTERLHAAYREHLGFTPEHGYRGDYVKEETE